MLMSVNQKLEAVAVVLAAVNVSSPMKLITMIV